MEWYSTNLKLISAARRLAADRFPNIACSAANVLENYLAKNSDNLITSRDQALLDYERAVLCMLSQPPHVEAALPHDRSRPVMLLALVT